MPRLHTQNVEAGMSKRYCTHADWRKCACDWYVIYKGKKKNLTDWWSKHHPKGKSGKIDSYEAARRAFGQFKDLIDGNGGTLEAVQEVTTLAETTFAQVITAYLQWREDSDREFASDAFGYMAEIMKTDLGHYTIKTLSSKPKIVEDWFNATRKARTWSKATRNRWRALGVMIFKWAQPRYAALELGNPFVIISKVKEGNFREVRITEAMEEKLIAAAKALKEDSELMLGRLYAALDTGMRVSEVMGVKFKYLDFETWTITLPASVCKGGKHTGLSETVHVRSERLQKWLKARWMALGREAEKFPFGTPLGNHQDAFDRPARHMFKAAGMAWDRTLDETGKANGFCWHDLRHEFAFRAAVEGNGNVMFVMELTRIKSFDILKRYVALADQWVKTRSKAAAK